jgi:hypothetical protein
MISRRERNNAGANVVSVGANVVPSSERIISRREPQVPVGANVKISRRYRGAPAGANELTRRERKSAGANEAPQVRTESPVGANVGAPAGANAAQ